VLVIDVSAAVQASLSPDGFSVLSSEELVAPALLLSGGRSVLHELGWRGTISRALADQALGRLVSAPIATRRPLRLAEEAWRVADELGWAKTYDAEYLALARLMRCRLLTLDGRRRRRAASIVEIGGRPSSERGSPGA
jgi:predicted nucleic acid-binding protein